jgi:hypothetical protein
MKPFAIIFILLSFCQIIKGQTVEFVVEDTTGKRLQGAVYSKHNAVLGISDTSGVIKAKDYNSLGRVHLIGYNDIACKINAVLQKVILVPNNMTPRPLKFKYDNPVGIKMLEVKHDFNITSVDSLVPGDTILEKVTRFNVEVPSVIGVFFIPVVKTDERYNDFELALYNEKNGKPDSSLLKQIFTGHLFDLGIAFNLFDCQIELLPGSYYIGYRRRVNKLWYSERSKQYIDANYFVAKSSNGAPTFKKINWKNWVPIYMPKSTIKKPRFYSYAYALELITHK